MAVRIEDAGFEIRDMIAWVYGSGFPKSLDVSKTIDKRGGIQVAWFAPWFRRWRKKNGITQKQVAALFPSKTGRLTGCVANWELGLNMPTPEQFNLIRDMFGLPFASVEEAEREVVGQHSTEMGGLGGQRLGKKGGDITAPATEAARQWAGWGTALKPALEPITVARKPLMGTVAENVLAHGTGALNVDGCRVGSAVGDEPLRWEHGRGMGFHGAKNRGPCQLLTSPGRWPANLIHDGSDEVVGLLNDAARFFYCAKASKRDRDEGNNHPTVKPTDLMRYLCRLVTPPGGTVLDPFMGSGSTGKAAMLEGLDFIGIERDPEYVKIAEARIGAAKKKAGLFG
jgi:transcriptional regulator with XRE-family HTH domain